MRDTAADFSTVRDDIAELRSQINGLIGDLKAATVAKAAELSHEVPERGAEVVREKVRESPLAALAMSFVAGCVVARLWR
jgi:hypothetical protein